MSAIYLDFARYWCVGPVRVELVLLYFKSAFLTAALVAQSAAYVASLRCRPGGMEAPLAGARWP